MVKYNISTYLHIVTSTLTEYAKGSKNVTLHYQTTICILQGIVSLLYTCTSGLNCICGIHDHIGCRECIVEIDDKEVCSSDLLQRVKLKDLSDNPMLWTSKEKLVVKESKQEFESVNSPTEKDRVLGVALDLFKRTLDIRRHLSSGQHHKAVLSAPLVWCMKMDNLQLLEVYTLIMSSHVAAERFDRVKQEISDQLIDSVIQWVEMQYTRQIFRSWINIFDPYNWLKITLTYIELVMPSSIQFTLSEKRAIHGAVYTTKANNFEELMTIIPLICQELSTNEPIDGASKRDVSDFLSGIKYT